MSCAYNPTIDFLLVTDQEEFPVVPPNVRVKQLGWSEFNELATRTIGLEVSLSSAQKLCDFKPAYGHLFEDLLEGWDYWGYSDLDVIYGDLRRYLTAARLHEYDVFTAQRSIWSGTLRCCRNDVRMRTLYRQSADFRTTLQAQQVLSFDECGKQWVQRLQGKPLGHDATCDSMTHVVHRLMADNTISACFTPAVVEQPELSDHSWRLRWQEGRLWFVGSRREAMYLHFHAFKQNRGYRDPCSIEADAAFDMWANGIERVSTPTELETSRAMVEPQSATVAPDPAIFSQKVLSSET